MYRKIEFFSLEKQLIGIVTGHSLNSVKTKESEYLKLWSLIAGYLKIPKIIVLINVYYYIEEKWQ